MKRLSLGSAENRILVSKCPLTAEAIAPAPKINVYVLGTELRSSTRAVGIVNY